MAESDLAQRMTVEAEVQTLAGNKLFVRKMADEPAQQPLPLHQPE